MKTIKSLFPIFMLLIALFCNKMSIHAEKGADGYHHDIIRVTDTHFKGINTGCQDFDYQGNIVKYNLYIAANNGNNSATLFNFISGSSPRAGLVTTESQGRIKSVKLGCSNNESVAGNSCFYIYGKNTPYSSTADLSSDATKGELIGTVDKADKNSDFNVKSFSGDKQYKYIAICASKGLFLEYFDIAWEEESEVQPYTRSDIPAKSLGTICLPYAVKKDGINGVKVFEMDHKITENNEVSRVVFKKVDEMEAGMPYFYYFPSENSGTLTLTLTDGPVDKPSNKNGLYGTFVDLPFTQLDSQKQESVYVVNSSGQLQRAATSSGVKANRAYVIMNEVSDYPSDTPSASRLEISADGFSILDDLTTIIDLETTNDEPVMSNSYNIFGTKLPKRVGTKTIIISNGRKSIQ